MEHSQKYQQTTSTLTDVVSQKAETTNDFVIFHI